MTEVPSTKWYRDPMARYRRWYQDRYRRGGTSLGKPVKVSTTLFESLREEAARERITIQDALSRRLEGAEAKAKNLGARLRKQEELLRTKEAELKAARSKGDSETARAKALSQEIRDIRQTLNSAQSEQEELSESLTEWQAAAGTLEQSLNDERDRRSEEKRTYNVILTVLGAVIVVGGAVALWRHFKNGRARAKPEAEPEKVQDPTGIWTR